MGVRESGIQKRKVEKLTGPYIAGLESSAVLAAPVLGFMNSILPRVSIVDFPGYSPASNLGKL